MYQSLEKRNLAQQIKGLLVNCIGFEGDELQKARTQAFDYYFQRPRGDEVVGRSSIVTGDLSSMVEGNLAQMTEPLSNRRIAEFCAYDGDDEEQAQLESDCINELVFKRQNGFIELTSAIKSAMLLRNAVCKVFIDERTHKRTIRKENVDPAAIEELVDSIAQQQSTRGVTVDVQVHKYDRKNKKFSATVTKTAKEFRVCAIAPENLLVPKNWDKHDLRDVPFCAERHVETRATAVERGFDKAIIDEIPRWSAVQNKETQNARVPAAIGYAANLNSIDKSQELIEWYECYMNVDDGHGASELRCICVGGNIVIEDEPADFIQYAVGAIIINPHSFIAISLFDKLKSTQDTTTALTRALMDNLNSTTKNRTAHLDGVVEETDITDGRTNGSIRVSPSTGVLDVRQAITAFSVPDTSGNILANLEHMRRTRSEMGGATLDMATGQMQMSDRLGSQGLDRAYSVMEQLASFMTKTIANTLIRSIYLLAHETLRTQWKGPIAFKRNNMWVTQEPSKWQARSAVEVNLGKSIGERARESAVLEKLMTKQESLAQAGMEDVLVDAPSYYRATLAWLRCNDIGNPEQYFIDPRSEKAQTALRNKAARAAQQQQKQDNLMQQAVSMEQIRIAMDKYKTDAELQFKYWSEAIGAQIEEAKLTLQGVVDIMKANKESKNAADAGSKEASGESSTGKPAIAGDSPSAAK